MIVGKYDNKQVLKLYAIIITWIKYMLYNFL